MRKYYYHAQGESHGPFDLEELQDELPTDDTLVWCEGMPHWMPANRMPELNPASLPPLPHEEKGGGGSFKEFLIGIVVIVLFLALISLSDIKRYLFGDNRAQTEQVETPVATNEEDPSQEAINIDIPLVEQYYNSKEKSRASQPVKEASKPKSYAESNPESYVSEPEPGQPSQEEQKLIELRSKIDYRWSEFLDVAIEDTYHVDALGGIQNVYANIMNNSDFVINEIIYIVPYLKQNGKIWKHEKVIEHNIQPRSTFRMRIPDSHRGVAVGDPIIAVFTINSIQYKWIDPEHGM
jgi:hypothetical protein